MAMNSQSLAERTLEKSMKIAVAAPTQTGVPSTRQSLLLGSIHRELAGSPSHNGYAHMGL
jgi:hypothetical protein